MPDLINVRRALISVSDKTDISAFAKSLVSMGIEIVSTGGTARALEAEGIPTRPVEDVTGFPEMMDGRVKTLHPKIHGGILSRRDHPSHVEAMNAHDIQPIDLVCINLYPFERTVSNPDVSEEEAIEQIDIGGPAILRSASKNHDYVTTVTSPSQYDDVISELQTHAGSTTLHLRRKLAAAAFARTAGYDATISNWLANQTEEGLAPRLHITSTQVATLRYGENPHQKGALYALPGTKHAGIANARTVDGKPLSYNNLNDAAAAYRICRDLARSTGEGTTAVVIKHASPCGLAHAQSAPEAFELAWSGDPLAAFGGIVGISTPLDEETAQCICNGDRFIEVLLAPALTPEGVALCSARWKNLRLVEAPDLLNPPPADLEIRTIPGGLLVQTPDLAAVEPAHWKHAAGPSPTDDQLNAARIAWVAAKHAASNAITIAADNHLIGLGAGQVDRLSAARIAVSKAHEVLADAHAPVAASDAFFPFSDGPQTLIDAGVSCLIHPGGSKRDNETLELCDERGVTCLLTGIRHFRH
ncbi:MAG: bifunctional phosphoribosylaminoimidazolecarboxamide formyltransferase/IMP cyclohydrolase [Phycisphaerales bacterium]|nr:bifunctional phosphoribosylaminoimidazolecarboxamide formyltransferase/IMP cyclohydrolase [Phycisphaerales bacterium]